MRKSTTLDHLVVWALASLVAQVPLPAQTLPIVVQKTTTCATSVDGSVVGVLNPQTAPMTNPIIGGVGDALPVGNYYVEFAWYDAAGHTTLVSPEVQVQLTGIGGIGVNPPASGVASLAAGMSIYIGTSSGGETYQGQSIGSGYYIQSTPLIAGAAPPATNTTICQQIANDAGWPTGTGYNVSLIDNDGNALPGYPMQWQLLGPGTTLSLNNGLPFYNGTVSYPIPILARPYNHAGQSISGPVSMTGYGLTNVGRIGVGTTVPGWGVDAEAAPNNALLGMINASNGFLVGGNGGTAGQCLASDGTTFDTAVACLTTLPTIYYQTVDSSGEALPQEPALNFTGNGWVTGTTAGVSTNVSLNLAGNGAYVASYGSTPGTSTACATFDGSGNIIPASAGCFGTSGVTRTNCLTTACAGGSTYAAGTTYTNTTGTMLTEEVGMNVTGSCTGSDNYISYSVNGVAGYANGVWNQCSGGAGVSFTVPPAGTFEVVLTHVDGGGTPSLGSWVETKW